MSFAVISVFEFANREIGEQVYDLHLLSETGGPLRSSIGISVATEPFDETNFDTPMGGGSALAGALAAGGNKFLRPTLERFRPITPTCTGAVRPPRSGPLHGPPATT